MKKSVAICLFALYVLPACSWDFCQKNKDGVMLYYNFYDDDFQMCEVAYCEGAEYTCFELYIPDVVTLPAKYEGRDEDTVLAVVGIEAHAFEQAQFSYVHLPETVSEIGDYAFSQTPLRRVEFGKEWCFRIGNRAFCHCEELDSVTIPSCVMEIGESAFSRCYKLHHLVIEDNDNIKELPAGCFQDCEIRNFTLPSFIKKIGATCFTHADIQVECSALSYDDLSKAPTGEPSSVIRERVLKARQIQEHRFQAQKGIHCNAQMTERMIHQYAEPNESSLALLRMAMERLKLSARAYNRI